MKKKTKKSNPTKTSSAVEARRKDILAAYADICMTLSPLAQDQRVRLVKAVAACLGMDKPHSEHTILFAHALQGILAAGYTNLPVGNVIAMARLYAEEGERELCQRTN